MSAPTAAPARPRPVVRRPRPMNEYWDVFSASWRTRPVLPVPRSGD